MSDQRAGKDHVLPKFKCPNCDELFTAGRKHTCPHWDGPQDDYCPACDGDHRQRAEVRSSPADPSIQE